VGPYTGGNVNKVLDVRSVQEMEGEAYSGGVSCQEVERRGLYRRRCEACTGGGPSTGGGVRGGLYSVQEVV
jgi:hypothetical protein